MYLENLPTETLLQICKGVVADGPHHLVGLTRVSHRFHNICNRLLYEKDAETNGGPKSIRHGLETGLNNVVALSLSYAKADPNVRIVSRSSLGILHSENVQTIADKPFMSPGEFYWNPLHVAAARGDVGLLDLLLGYNADPNAAGRGVCVCQHLPIRRTFIDARSQAKKSDRDLLNMIEFERRLLTRWSPLHVALCNQNFECAEKLFDRFGFPHAIESDQTVIAQARMFREELPFPDRYYRYDPTPRFDPLPPLHVAAANYTSVEAFEWVYSMLERAGHIGDADVDAMDAFGDTPFAVAAFSRHTQVLGKWLHDHGADINFVIRDSRGVQYSIFRALCKSSAWGQALLLMDYGVDVHKDTQLILGGRLASALNLCCGYDFGDLGCSISEIPEKEKALKQPETVELIKRLIHAGVDVDAKAESWDYGVTPLMSAARVNFLAAIVELLEGGADIGLEDDYGWSALAWAVESGMEPAKVSDAVLDTIRLLLKHGADPNQCCEAKGAGPPLFAAGYACTGDRSRGESFPSPRWHRRHYAGEPSSVRDGRRSSMASIAPLLVANGANPNIYLKDPRDLEEGGLDIQLHRDSLVVSAFFMGQFDAVDSLLECGAVVTFQDYVLMMRSLTDQNLRSRGRKSEVVESLFRILNSPSLKLKGPHDRNSIMDAWTELLYYAVGSRPKLVPVLASRVILTEKCGPGGKTVLHILAQWSTKMGETMDHFDRRVDEVMAGLLRCGAGRLINQPDNHGWSPLHVAVQRGNFSIAKTLLDSGASVQWLLYDVVSHFAANGFDEPTCTALSTMEQIRKAEDLGAEVDESDELRNNALHLVFQFLYPNDGLQNVNLVQVPGWGEIRSVNVTPADHDPGHMFVLGTRNIDMNMNGHNIYYGSDSDFEARDGDDVDSDLDSDKSSSDDTDESY